MIRFTVDLGTSGYPIVVAPDTRLALEERVAELAPSTTVVVTDEHVAGHHAERVTEPLRVAGVEPLDVIRLAPGEPTKTLEELGRLVARLREVGLDRKGLVVALGGGVVGDIAGFAAAVYLRGVDVIQVPTTLLAQVDSSVGGKTGVNLPAGKNLVGAFHQPRGVFVSTEVLATLDEAEFLSAFGEVVKYGLISEPDLFERLEQDPAPALARDADALTQIIGTCLRSKAAVVEKDEREGGLRAVLNVGHTIGHALEAVTSYARWRHGEAVAIGLVAEARLAARLGRAEESLAPRIARLLRRLGLPVHHGLDDPSAALPYLRADKKATHGSLRFALPCDLGQVDIVDDVPEALVGEVLAEPPPPEEP